MNENITAAILSGGKSSRMGKNKSFAVKFRDFVLSKKAQLIIQSYGFEPAIKL